MIESLFRNAVNISRQMVSQVVKPGDVAVDATCGRGKDTLLLANLVGEKGRVYAFDIQEEAIKDTWHLLAKNGIAERVVLIKQNHIYVDAWVRGSIKACMFNLGYLPGGDHDVKTEAGSTVAALQKILKRLAAGGLASIVGYSGHEGGREEIEAVRGYLAGLPQQDYEIIESRFLNQVNCPPLVIMAHKLKESCK